MFTRTPKNGWTWYQDGCHSIEIGCIAEGREKCECKYHLSNGVEQFAFDTYSEAEEKWSILTGEEKFVLGKSVWN